MFEWTDLAYWKREVISANNIEFLLWLFISAAVAFTSGFGIFRNLRRARIIEDTPTSKIRSAVQGYVELIGMGQYFNETPLYSPLTLSQCIWYHYIIEKREVQHTDDGIEISWQSVESDKSSHYFKLLDNTGHCVVNPFAAEVHPKIKDVWYGDTRWPSKSSVIKRHKSSFFNQSDYRYTEKRLVNGDGLYILGDFKTVGPDADTQGINESISKLLKLWKTQQKNLLEKFDSNQDGEIDLKEWQRVREAAAEQILQDRLDNSVEPVTHLVQETDQKDRPFIISRKPQKPLSQRFRLFAGLSLMVFIIAAPGFIWMLMIRFGN